MYTLKVTNDYNNTDNENKEDSNRTTFIHNEYEDVNINIK